MDTSHTGLPERIARVLAGQKLSANANGSLASANEQVEQSWRDHLADAVAILRVCIEPDAEMLEVGDGETWGRMVRAALGEDILSLKREGRSWRDTKEIYQKPLG